MAEFREAGSFVLNTVSAASSDEDGYRRSYVEGNRRIVEWLRSAGPVEQFIYTSSTSVYSQTDGSVVTEEDAGTVAETVASGYRSRQQILFQAEQLVLQAQTEGLAGTAIVLRLAGLYGPQRHHILDQLRRGERDFAGPGDHYLNLIHRDDAAAAIQAVVRQKGNAPGGVYNLADGHPPTKQALTEWVAAQLGQPPPKFNAAQPGERNKRRMVSGGKLPHRIISAQKFCRIFNWQPGFGDYRQAYSEWIRKGKDGDRTNESLPTVH